MFKKLLENRATLKAQIEELLKNAKTENRALNEDEIKKFGELEGSIKAIDATINAEERARNIPQLKGNEPEDGDEKAKIEKEERAFVDYVLNKATENRASAQLTEGENGVIVPVSIAGHIITKVKQRCPFLQLCTVYYTNGKLSVPVYGDSGENHITAAYVEEGKDLADNVGKFTTIDLSGHVLGALALLSIKLKDNTDLDVLDFMEDQIADSIVGLLESECVNGTTKIKGILNAKNVKTAAASNAITYDELVTLKHSVPQQHRKDAKWLMHPDTYTEICKLKDQNGQPYFKEDEYKVLNCEVIESESMPKIGASAKAILFGNMKGFSIKATKKLEIKVLREKYATQYMIGILGFGEYDGAITDEQMFALLQMGA